MCRYALLLQAPSQSHILIQLFMSFLTSVPNLMLLSQNAQLLHSYILLLYTAPLQHNLLLYCSTTNTILPYDNPAIMICQYFPRQNLTTYVVLGDIRKIKTVRYCHKIPRYDGIVIVTKF